MKLIAQGLTKRSYSWGVDLFHPGSIKTVKYDEEYEQFSVGVSFGAKSAYVRFCYELDEAMEYFNNL